MPPGSGVARQTYQSSPLLKLDISETSGPVRFIVKAVHLNQGVVSAKVCLHVTNIAILDRGQGKQGVRPHQIQALDRSVIVRDAVDGSVVECLRWWICKVFCMPKRVEKCCIPNSCRTQSADGHRHGEQITLTLVFTPRDLQGVLAVRLTPFV